MDKSDKTILEQSKKIDKEQINALLSDSHIPKEYLHYSWRDKVKDVDSKEKIYDIYRGIGELGDNMQATIKSRREAKIRALKYSRDIDSKINTGKSLFISGGKNSGKTVLATLIMRDAIEYHGCSVKFMQFAEFVNIADQKFGDELAEIISHYSYAYTILLIDEITEHIKARDRVKDCLFNILQNRRFGQFPTIITAKSLGSVNEACGPAIMDLVKDQHIYEEISIESVMADLPGLRQLRDSGAKFRIDSIINSLDLGHSGKRPEYIDSYSLAKAISDAIEGKKQI